MSDPAETNDAVTIRIREDGPLLVTGPITLTNHEGTPITCDGPNVALCRCGLSAKKPFCDGTHRGQFDGTLADPEPETDAST